MKSARILLSMTAICEQFGIDPLALRVAEIDEEQQALVLTIEHEGLPEVEDGAPLPLLTTEMRRMVVTVPTGRLMGLTVQRTAQNGRADPASGRIVLDGANPWRDGQPVKLATDGDMPGGLDADQIYQVDAADETGFELRLPSGETPKITSAGDPLVVTKYQEAA